MLVTRLFDLLEEFETADENGFFRFAAAYAEEGDDGDHCGDDAVDADGDPAENGNDAEEHGKRQNDLDLQRLLYMERGIG